MSESAKTNDTLLHWLCDRELQGQAFGSAWQSARRRLPSLGRSVPMDEARSIAHLAWAQAKPDTARFAYWRVYRYAVTIARHAFWQEAWRLAQDYNRTQNIDTLDETHLATRDVEASVGELEDQPMPGETPVVYLIQAGRTVGDIRAELGAKTPKQWEDKVAEEMQAYGTYDPSLHREACRIRGTRGQYRRRQGRPDRRKDPSMGKIPCGARAKPST